MITPLNEDLNIVVTLDDEPNDEGGLTPVAFKAKFDEGPNAIKDYINDTLIPELADERAGVTTEITAAVAAAQIQSGNMPAGGTAGQVMVKNSGTNYDYGWGTTVADPVNAGDIANKGYVDGAIATESTNILNNVSKIGDVKLTTRTDLGSKWALCNGALVRQPDYPDLYSVLTTGIVYYGSTWLSATGLSAIKGLTFLNGIYFFYGTVGASNYPAISYSTSLSKTATWTVVQTSSTWTNAYVTNLEYVNGYYFLFSNNYYVQYSNVLTSGTWSYLGDSTYSLTGGVAYGNGYYVFSGCKSSDSTGYIFYTTNLSALTAVALSGEFEVTQGVIFDGTRFIVCTRYNSINFRIYTATTPTTWTFTQAFDVNGSGGFHAKGFLNINGNYIVFGYPTGAPYYNWIAYSSTYNGTYTVVKLSTGINYSSGILTYQNGLYIIPVYNGSGLVLYYYNASLANIFSTSFYISNSDILNRVLWSGSEYFLIKDYSTIMQSTLIAGDAKPIPTIADNSTVHSYIKLIN